MECVYKLLKQFSKSNGCGSKSNMISRITYWLIPSFIFAKPCNCHDDAYTVGGCKAFDNSFRYRADYQFLQDMYSNIEERVWRFARKGYRKAARIYYEAVREHGQDAFAWFDTIEAWRNHLVSINRLDIYENALAEMRFDLERLDKALAGVG